MYQIEKGIPIPSGKKPTIYPLSEMQAGDSFLMKNVTAAKQTSIYGCAKEKGIKICCRRLGQDLRVWRVA